MDSLWGGVSNISPAHFHICALLGDTKAFTTSRGPFVFPSVFLCVFSFFLICFPKSCQATCVTRGSEKSESSKPIGTRSLIYFWSTLLFSLNFRHTQKKNSQGKRANCRVEGVWFSFQAALLPCLALPEWEPLQWGERGRQAGGSGGEQLRPRLQACHSATVT